MLVTLIQRERLVVIGQVETDAGARRHANLVHRHDAEHQRAGGIADAVDDHPLVALPDAGVFRLVLFDIAAVVTRDVQIGARRACGQAQQQKRGERRDAEHEAVGQWR